MPVMGTTAAETWESGTFAAVSGGTTLVVDFVIPGPDGMLAALDDWEGKAKRQASSDYSLHMCVNGWSKKHFDEMPNVSLQQPVTIRTSMYNFRRRQPIA
jgi:dihydropyrimidinase